MSVAVRLDDLLDYSDHERRKWRDWLMADPTRLKISLQPAGRFTTVQALLDHVFLVERRHLCRLEGSTPPESTGIADGDMAALFEYADLVRKDFRSYLDQLDAAEAAAMMTVSSPALGHYTVQRWKLATHMVLHEIRHLAQLALAARMAGQAPPGEHDFFFYPGAAVKQA
jgi:uncharacterized damage-inducible protein DinB